MLPPDEQRALLRGVTARSIDRAAFFAAMRAHFGALLPVQVEGAETLLGFIAADPDAADIRHAAYMLGTAWHETARTLQPIAERGGVRYFDRYDPVLADSPKRRATALRMGNARQGDGYRYRGRGYVQTTWAINYRRLGEAVGVDLLADPDRAMEPAIAYVALSRGLREGWYTGQRLDQYLTARATDYAGARRVVNGTDRAAEIAAHAIAFERALGAGAWAAPGG